RDRNTGFLRHHGNGFRERQPVNLHAKMNRAARLAAAVAMEDSLLGRYREGRRSFRMERTQPLHILAALGKVNGSADRPDNVMKPEYGLNCLFRNSAAGHPTSPSSLNNKYIIRYLSRFSCKASKSFVSLC